MKIRTALVPAAVMLLTLLLPAWAQEMTHGQAIKHGTSPAIRDIAITVPMPTGFNSEVLKQVKPDLGWNPDLAEPDGGLQSDVLRVLGSTPAPILSVQGLSEDDNFATVGVNVVPPSPSGDIGLDGDGNRIYVQYINLIWGVFSATTGALTAGPFPGNILWAGFGGPCETSNNGDPIVFYDDQAGRWVLSQFAVSSGTQCVAVSTTSDPLGTYHLYAFVVTPGGANDYPKLGAWDDGTTLGTGQSAYTFTTRDFGGAGGAFSMGAGVMERDQMLVGGPAQFVKFSNPCVAGTDCLDGQVPPHLAGPPPPAGTCPTFWTAIDAAFDASPFVDDGYRNHTLCVDWSNPANSTYTEGPLVVAGSNFDRFLGNGFSDCITPVFGGEDLDCLALFTMYHAQYRYSGTNASVVINTTVDAGADRAGIRWAETRSADGDSGWFLQQDGTYAPDDGLERWMGSIAQDGDGNIALGYSVTGASLYPSVRYTSRMGGDAAGTLPGGEVSCHEGTGAQINSANRWGDYSSMSVDPTDDCTFWYTQEYYETTGSFDFKTRICSFGLPGCGTPCVPDETPEATCDDGVDNDCDGDFDCFDSDCAGDPACAPEGDNDACFDAIEIVCPEGGGSVTVSGSTTSATFDNVGFCGTSNTAPGVWYKVAHGAMLTASTCNQASYDTKISVFDGSCDTLGCVTGLDDTAGCAGFTTELSWPGNGAESLILIHGFGSATGDFDLTITCEADVETVCDDADGDCFADNGTPGCEQTDCCNQICDSDPFCCEVSWDATCAFEAEEFCEPLLAVIDDFTAEVTPRGVQLHWNTLLEIDNAGFNILRRRGHRQMEQVNAQLITARGNGLDGASYSFLDSSRQPPGKVEYFLQDVDLWGNTSLHGPVSVELQRPTRQAPLENRSGVSRGTR